MDKILKTIFQPNEKKSNKNVEESDENKNETPPLDDRRKLSISRSGRLKQNKKRHQLSLELYGEDQPATVSKPTSLEYHVNTNANRKKVNPSENKRKYPEPSRIEDEITTPEEEIDKAFQVVDDV